jgi:arsenate reductase-like glutaredoxin family protein
VVTVFTRKITDDLASLVKEIDNTVSKNSSQNMKAFVVYLGDDPAAAEKKLQAMAKKHKITKTPLTVFQTEEGPPNYRISRDADVTVLMWSSRNVKANVAFGKKPLTKEDIQKVVKSTAKILK